MAFLEDFCHLASGNECPPKFLIWSGLSLLGAVAGKKLTTGHGSGFVIDPRLYICLVGTPGSGKSTAMEQAEKIFIKNFPNMLISESIQSREDILAKMSADTSLKTYKHPSGRVESYRPFYCIVDEMENFVSVDDKKMVGMLVGIYSRDSFGTGFKNDANKNQRIDNPYLSLIACTIPEWMMSSLRVSLFTGGLGRRMIIVHCKKDKTVPEPNRPHDYEQTMSKVVTHLKQLDLSAGHLHWTPAARRWWNTWYMAKAKKPSLNPILIQFEETQHIMLQKIALLLAVSEKDFRLEIDEPHMAAADALLSELKPDIELLTSGIGRNELAGISGQLMELLNRKGFESEVNVKKIFWRHANSPEFRDIENHLISTGQVILYQLEDKAKVLRRYYCTQAGYEEIKRLEAMTKTSVEIK